MSYAAYQDSPTCGYAKRVLWNARPPTLTSLVIQSLCLLWSLFAAASSHAQAVFVEAEQFASLGGWDLDQQSMEQMGSTNLLAQGLGVPVRDAVTKITVPQNGRLYLGQNPPLGSALESSWCTGQVSAFP